MSLFFNYFAVVDISAAELLKLKTVAAFVRIGRSFSYFRQKSQRIEKKIKIRFAEESETYEK